MPVKTLMGSNSTTDPLSLLLAPSRSETPEQRDKRVQQEEEAKRISNAIDEELNKERKTPKPVKILLLGMFETMGSGFSADTIHHRF